jgi:hypothetical protein
MRSAETAAGFSVEVFVEQYVIAELRVILLGRPVTKDRPASLVIAEKDAA